MLNSILERRFKDGQKEERQRILEMINKQKQDNKNNETLSPDDIDMLNGELDELKTKISEGKKWKQQKKLEKIWIIFFQR